MERICSESENHKQVTFQVERNGGIKQQKKGTRQEEQKVIKI